MRLYQLGSEAFPPLRTMHATNLPVQPVALIGREREQAELADLLEKDGPRLVTLLGPGGIGKTSLALAVAAERVPLTPSGVFFVDLTRVRHPEEVSLAIAQTIGAKGDLALHVGDSAMLLVLDNMEHVISAGTDVAQLLGHCPNLRLLVTSRIRLRVRGEREYPMNPLQEDASTTLFLERAHAVDPSVTADQAVLEICRRLEGLPLAIELAASRLRALSAPELLQRLEKRFALLTGGPQDLPDRQQTLRATVAWSVDLLAPSPRALFPRLAVFVGGWMLEAAETVCGATLDDLGALVEQSLVQRTANRYGMLETIRDFAAEDLAGARNADALHERHARFYADVCREALDARGFVGEVGGFIDDDEFLTFARADSPNLGAALEWLEAHSEGKDLAAIAGAIWFYWLSIGATEVGERWLQAALDLTDTTDSPGRAWLLAVLGEFPRFTGDYPRAIQIKLGALEMSRRVGDHGTMAAVLADLTSLHALVGEFEAARRFGEEALQIRRAGARQIGVAGGRGVAHALQALAEAALKSGDPREAERLMREADELDSTANSPPRDRVWTAFILEETLRGQGRLDEARALAGDVLARGIDLEYPLVIWSRSWHWLRSGRTTTWMRRPLSSEPQTLCTNARTWSRSIRMTISGPSPESEPNWVKTPT
jgi:predicted ATPase